MKCERCGGNGIIIDPETRRCPDCNGTGEKPESQEKEYSTGEYRRLRHFMSGTITPDPPEESQDERIRPKAGREFDRMVTGSNTWTSLERFAFLDGAEFGFKSRDEEVSYYRKINILQKSEITALREQIEEMKCLYTENYRQLLNEAKSLYQHYPNNFRKTEDEYFLEENEFLTELEKEK